MARFYGLALIVFGGVVFLTLAIRFFPTLVELYRERRNQKHDLAIKRLLFERTKDLLVLITYDPELARAVARGLRSWSPPGFVEPNE